MPEGDLYEQIIEAVHANFGSHPGKRALHAKGSWAQGEFTATPAAARLSRAPHLQGETVTALVRFSNASGDPEAHDADRDGRGMAIKLRWDGGETDILTTTSPTFVSRTPEEFLELMLLRRPDPATGQPDMEKLGAYFGDHPESVPAVQAVLMKEPIASFATAEYFSPHSFGLVDAGGNRTWVRYHLRPEAGEQRLADDEAKATGAGLSPRGDRRAPRGRQRRFRPSAPARRARRPPRRPDGSLVAGRRAGRRRAAGADGDRRRPRA